MSKEIRHYTEDVANGFIHLWAKKYRGLTRGLTPTYKLYRSDLTEEEFSELFKTMFSKVKIPNNKHVSMVTS